MQPFNFILYLLFLFGQPQLVEHAIAVQEEGGYASYEGQQGILVEEILAIER